MKKTFISIAVLVLTATVNAQNNPVSLATDARIKKVLFRENDVVLVQGIPFTTTQIVFSDKERVLDVEGGDTTAWMVTYHPELANMIFVKPTAINSSTNMTIITNQRVYYFHLKSNKKVEPLSKQQTYALKFEYPQPQINKVSHQTSTQAKVNLPKVVNTAYRFSGNPQLIPRRVFDDGKFTYFELSEQGSVSAIFAVDDQSGKESTVNTRREGKYVIVQRIAPQFTLRQGGLTASVFNGPEINRIAANRRPK